MKTGLFLRLSSFMRDRLFRDEERLARWFLAYCLAVSLAFLWTLTQIDVRLFPGDFVSFYSAGHIVAKMDPSRVLDPDLQYSVQERLLSATGREMNRAVIKFLYPPVLAWVFVPLTWLPLIPAYTAWSVLNLGLLLAGVLLLSWSHMRPGFDPRIFLARALAAVSFLPVLLNFLQGQTGVLLFFLLALGYVLVRNGRPGLGGLVLGLSLIKPQLVLLPLILLLIERRWKAVSGVAAAVGVLVLGSLLTVGSQGFLDYPEKASRLLDDPGINPLVMPNLRGTVFRIGSWYGQGLDRGTGNAVALVLGAAGLAACAGYLYSRRAPVRTPQDFPLSFSFALAAGLILSPHLYAYDLALILLPGLILLAGLSGEKDPPEFPGGAVSIPGETGRKVKTGVGLFHIAYFVCFLLFPEPVTQQGAFLFLAALTLGLPWFRKSVRGM